MGHHAVTRYARRRTSVSEETNAIIPTSVKMMRLSDESPFPVYGIPGTVEVEAPRTCPMGVIIPPPPPTPYDGVVVLTTPPPPPEDVVDAVDVATGPLPETTGGVLIPPPPDVKVIGPPPLPPPPPPLTTGAGAGTGSVVVMVQVLEVPPRIVPAQSTLRLFVYPLGVVTLTEYVPGISVSTVPDAFPANVNDTAEEVAVVVETPAAFVVTVKLAGVEVPPFAFTVVTMTVRVEDATGVDEVATVVVPTPPPPPITGSDAHLRLTPSTKIPIALA